MNGTKTGYTRKKDTRKYRKPISSINQCEKRGRRTRTHKNTQRTLPVLDQTASDPYYKSEKIVPSTVEYCISTNYIKDMSKTNPATNKNTADVSDTRKNKNCASEPTGTDLTGSEKISMYCTCPEQIYNLNCVNLSKSYVKKTNTESREYKKTKKNRTNQSITRKHVNSRIVEKIL